MGRGTEDAAAGTGDVAARLADGQWAWYYRTALRTVIQACGRVVRAPDDRGATYVADTSILDLFERARTDMPPWFREQVDRMSVPDLPEVDADAALGDTTGGVDQVEAPSSSGGNATGSGGRAATGASAESGDGDDEKNDQPSVSGPMADVWNTE